jgi:peroxisomal enoyl-CoA hydratase 2
VVDFYQRSGASAGPPIPDVPRFDVRRVVDGERKLEFLKPLPASSAGRRFELRSKVLGIYDKGKPGTVVETEQTLVDVDSNEVYSRAVGSAFYVGQGGWGGPKGTLSSFSGPLLSSQDEAFPYFFCSMHSQLTIAYWRD